MTGRRLFLKNSLVLFGSYHISKISWHPLNINTKHFFTFEDEVDFFDTLQTTRETEDALFLYGYKRIIDKKLAAAKKNLVIVCHELEIATGEDISAKSIFILANTLKCSVDATVSTVGKSYVLGEAPPKAGRQSNQPGSSGNDGDNVLSLPGGNGGSVTIRIQKLTGQLNINAQGGQGRNGQEGGDGIKGKIGDTGQDKKSGDKGFPGGDAGNGADGGKGGKGGNVHIHICNTNTNVIHSRNGGFGVTPPDVYQITNVDNKGTVFVNNLGGSGGSPGKCGQPGEGGDGGIGGDDIVHHSGSGGNARNGGGNDESYQRIPHAYPTGPIGDPGKAGKDGKSGDFGKSGVLNVGTDSEKAFAWALTKYPIYNTILDIKLDELYINQDFKTLVELLNWYGGVLSSIKLSDNKWQVTLSKINGYQHSIMVGLDFWGMNSSFISLLDVEVLNDKLNSYFTSAVEFEKHYKDFSDAVSSKQQKFDAAQDAVKLASSYLANKKTEVASLRNECDNLNREITSLSDQIEKMQVSLAKDEIQFREAVEHELNQCTVQRVLEFTSMAVNLGRAISGDVSGIIGAGEDISNVFSRNYDPQFAVNVVKKTKVLVSSAQTIDGRIEDLKKQYQSFSNMMNPTEDLFVIPEGSYQALIEKYGQLKSAQRLKTDYDNYCQICDNRNKRRIEITQKYNDYIIAFSQLPALEDNLSTKSINALLAQSNVISDDAILFMNEFYWKLRLDSLKLLAIEKKAFSYWTLNKATSSALKVQSLQVLQAEHARINKEMVDYLSLRGRGKSNGKIENAFVLNFHQDTLQFDQLKPIDKEKNHVLYFTINPDNSNFNVKDDCEIYVNAVRVIPKGILSDSGLVKIKIVQLGNSQFITEKGERLTFSHTSIAASMTWSTKGAFVDQITDNNLIGTKAQFLGISPFATWKLMITNADEIDLSMLRTITVGFDYSYFPVK